MKIQDAKATTSCFALEPNIEEVGRLVVDSALTVHRALGPGLLERVYEDCLAYELRSRRLKVERQVEVAVVYRGLEIEGGFRLDLLVEHAVIVELKSVESLTPLHRAQILTYLKLAGRRLGLLINFNVPRIKDGIRRVVL